MPKVTVVVPCYNNETTIEESLFSIIMQDYKDIEILVVDDGSTDSSVIKASKLAKVVKNEKNMGIGYTLARGWELSETEFIVYLCADDLFDDERVISEYMKIFEDRRISVIGHYFYQFCNGKVVSVSRDNDVLRASCNPSGMAFRRYAPKIEYTNRIFIEMPFIVKEALKHGRGHMVKWDTIAVRIDYGNNTAVKESYYTESPTRNWTDICGKDSIYFPMLIQLKNRAPKNVWREICEMIRINKKILINSSFWFFALTAVLLPSQALRRLTRLWRAHFARGKKIPFSY